MIEKFFIAIAPVYKLDKLNLHISKLKKDLMKLRNRKLN